MICPSCKKINEPWRTHCRQCSAVLGGSSSLGTGAIIGAVLLLVCLLSPFIAFGVAGATILVLLAYTVFKGTGDARRRAIIRLVCLYVISALVLIISLGAVDSSDSSMPLLLGIGFSKTRLGSPVPLTAELLGAVLYMLVWWKTTAIDMLLPTKWRTGTPGVPGDAIATSPAVAGPAQRAYTWESSVEVRPRVQGLPPVADASQLTQLHVDTYCAGSRQFWRTFHGELGASGTPWGDHAHQSLRQWNATVTNSLLTQMLGRLFQYPVIKGEFIRAYGGAALLTNYRLQILLDGVIVNIPLSRLTHYDTTTPPHVIYLSGSGQSVSLSITGVLVLNVFVRAALESAEFMRLDATQLLLLGCSWYDLGKAAPGVRPIEVGLGLDDAPEFLASQASGDRPPYSLAANLEHGPSSVSSGQENGSSPSAKAG